MFLEQLPEHLTDAILDAGTEAAREAAATHATGEESLDSLALHAVLHEADARRIHGRIDHVDEPAHTARRCAPNGKVEDALGGLDHALHDRGAAREHDAGGDQIAEAGFRDFTVDEGQDFFGPRLDDVGQYSARHDARRTPADRRHLDRLVLSDELAERAAVAVLDR